MPVIHNMKQQGMSSTKALATTRKPGPKAPGTRAGTLQDWREGSVKSGRVHGRLNTLRDGR
jgi:hypothetical protein